MDNEIVDNEKHKELRALLGEDQMDAIDADAEAVVNGDYDLPADEELDVLMDAEQDKEDESEMPETGDDVALIKNVIKECIGVDEEKMPRASVAASVEMVNTDCETSKSLATYSSYKAVVDIKSRTKYVEISLTYPAEYHTDMKTLLAHLKNYALLADEREDFAVEMPVFTLLLLPLGGLGSYYIACVNPIMWNIQPSAQGKGFDKLSILFEAENLSFYQTDEMDANQEAAAAMREFEEEVASREKIDQREEARRAEFEEYNKKIEDMRKTNSF